jgi:UDP-N-acetylmuramoylalanine--D-glutamate ligase
MLDVLLGQRVLVMGLGRFGGGVGVTRWLAGRGAKVIVNDVADEAALLEPLAAIRDLIDAGAVDLRLGGHDPRDFERADLVVANPAVKKPWEHDCLLAAQRAGVPVTTEIRLVVERLRRERVIGVTGSAGKSTTSAMIHHLLRASGRRSHLGGNFGGSLLLHLESIRPDDWIALELSSAMLHWLGAGVGFAAAEGWSPRVAVLTNLAPNHLDWHGTFEHYRASKENIRRFQRAGDSFVEGGVMDERIGDVALAIPGRHNRINAAVAARAVEAAGLGAVRDVLRLLADFPGLPHRLQFVAEGNGVRFYNDSKSTTPDATRLAVEAFDDSRRLHLIVGGSDKGSDLAPIAHLAPRLAGLYAIGATGERIVAAVPETSRDRAEYAGTLHRAVERAVERSCPGDVVLLSPGCASFDQFTNFERRGEAFVSLVRSAAPAASTA